jgi:putative hydrolase of the HAD superfamily
MRAVIFDLDDTLYPYEQFRQGGFRAVAESLNRHYGIPATDALRVLARAQVDSPGLELQAACAAFGVNDVAVLSLVPEFRNHMPVLCAFDGVTETLSKLRDSGWKLGILTNGLPHVQARKIHALGLRRLVDHVVFAAEYAVDGKPHIDAFREIVRRMEVPVERCVMVGDDVERDVNGARNAGLRTIHVRRADAPAASAADHVVGGVTEVPDALTNWFGGGTRHAA